MSKSEIIIIYRDFIIFFMIKLQKPKGLNN